MNFRFDRRNLNTQQQHIAAQRDRANKILNEADAKKTNKKEDGINPAISAKKNNKQIPYLSYTLWTKQVAEILGISPKKVIALIQTEQLLAVKSGRFWKVNKESVIEYKKIHNNSLTIYYFHSRYKYNDCNR